MDKKISVTYLEQDINYWVVRAGRDGAFLKHFEVEGIVALGHLDVIDYLDESISSNENLIRLLADYKKKMTDPESGNKASVSNKAGQISTFVRDMKTGDVVISASGSRFIFGVIESDAFRDARPVIIRGREGEAVGKNLIYTLRRKVRWNGSTSKNDLPASVKNSFKANQTVFKVTEHWRTLNHWMSVLFIKDDTAYFSTRIGQKEDISNFDVAHFGITLNKIEVLSDVLGELYEQGKIDEVNLEHLEKLVESRFAEFRRTRGFQLTTQQSFMSPGDYWGALQSSGSVKRVIFLMCMSLLFDVQPAFAGGDAEVAEEVLRTVELAANKIKEKEGFDYVSESLRLSMPSKSSVNLDELDFPEDEPDDFTGM